jgi:cellulose synthase/poly-beta-1,6-N-acetylglucosamine synthase-like glycosyltransferase
MRSRPRPTPFRRDAIALSDARPPRLRVFPSSIDVVVPCNNEEKTLPLSIRSILENLRDVIAANCARCRLRVILVDDGSCDRTWSVICSESRKNPRFWG